MAVAVQQQRRMLRGKNGCSSCEWWFLRSIYANGSQGDQLARQLTCSTNLGWVICPSRRSHRCENRTHARFAAPRAAVACAYEAQHSTQFECRFRTRLPPTKNNGPPAHGLKLHARGIRTHGGKKCRQRGFLVAEKVWGCTNARLLVPAALSLNRFLRRPPLPPSPPRLLLILVLLYCCCRCCCCVA